MKEAIQKAIEGGYELNKLLGELGINPKYEVKIGQKYLIVRSFQGNEKQLCSFEKILLDPLFWQCLGKSLKWNIKDPQFAEPRPHTGDTRTYLKSGYLYHWHLFIDHLAEGGDVDSFFTNLIK